MAINPSVQIPMTLLPSGSPISSPSTPKTPRSMLRNLFAWKKNSSVPDNDVVVLPTPDVASRPQTAASSQHPPTSLTRKPSFSHRSRSETQVPQNSRARSKSRRRSRSRCRAIWDPPPLFQAYSQAFMHDTLRIPNKGFLDWLPRGSSNRSSVKNSEVVEDDKDEIDSPISHRRSMSDSGSSSLSKKLFFLFENGHILQYKAEGSHDRLPERVLELSRDSVAFASDAVAGQRWVLEICPYGRAENETKPAASKSAWSRMTLRTQDNKKLAEKLLLVFESPDMLFNWLFAVRKQIEGLGGIEYQPDAPPVPQIDLKRPTLRHASSEYFKRKNGVLFSRSSSALPLKLEDHTAHEKELPQLPAGLSYQKPVSVRSAATSSVVTKSSLERLRESYSGSSTAGTAMSSDVSATSSSPTTEAFPPLLSPTLPREFRSRTNNDKPIPRTPTSPLHNSEERSPSPNSPPLPDYEEGSSVPIVAAEQTIDVTPLEEIATAEPMPEVTVADCTSLSSSNRPLSILDALPGVDFKRPTRHATRNLSTSEVDMSTSSDLRYGSSATRHHATKSSIGSTLKGTYGLFPKQTLSDTKTDSPVTLDRDLVPSPVNVQADDHVDSQTISIPSVNSSFATKLLARSDTTPKRPAPIGLSRLLRTLEIEQPMRSPAVTDTMLNTNFGIMPSGAATEPATPIEVRVPSLSDMNIDKKLLESLRQIEAEQGSSSPSPKPRSLVSRRSMPNFQYGTAGAASAPVGPPPSVPLPAVPPVSESRNSRILTPSKRASTHSTANRRASTKSASSIKKVRSPAPSFSVAGQDPRSFRSASFKLPPPADAQELSPFLTSLPVINQERTPFTIGQVSVTSPPPRASSLSQHKKSLSTSSTKSGRPRAHTRSSSIKSLQNSIANYPISCLPSPSCGMDPDYEPDSEGCFGIGISRMSN